MTFAPGGLNQPRSEALTQLRSVCSTNPDSRATGPTPCPAITRFTASSLNSAVYSAFGILNLSFLPFSHPIDLLMEDKTWEGGEARLIDTFHKQCYFSHEVTFLLLVLPVALVVLVVLFTPF